MLADARDLVEVAGCCGDKWMTGVPGKEGELAVIQTGRDGDAF